MPTYTTTTVMLEVSGRLWSGAWCKHEYPLRTLGGAAIPPPTTLAEAKRIAGDFADLTSARVIMCEETRTVTTRKVKL